MKNLLAQEASLYLQQHAHQPVHWRIWGPEALKEAEERGVPVLVSIGYSACHWCHVMAHECFENTYIANLMNQRYVCIKVDREERPDVDAVMMEAVQMITQKGGWPLNAFCLPNGNPFFGGTYFPPKDLGNGIVPWPQLLLRISEYYQKNRSDMEENAEAIRKNLLHSNQPPNFNETRFDEKTLVLGTQNLCHNHDDQYGGFGGAPKFPPSMSIDFLLSMRRTRAIEKAGLGERIDMVIHTTLQNMVSGGLYDQVGGGFYRYCVDSRWEIPHFEKMLYDNALLISTFSKAWMRYRHQIYRDVVYESIAWTLSDMKDPEGGFYASYDADSQEGEGDFYLWNPAEIEAVLGKPLANTFCQVYGVSESGNLPNGRTHLRLEAQSYKERSDLKDARQQLLEDRKKRPAPTCDKKSMVSWNALMIRSLVEAGFVFDEKKWFYEATQVALWLEEKAFFAEPGFSIIYQGSVKHEAHLDDYVFFLEALIAIASKSLWAEGEGERVAFWLGKIEKMATLIEENFKDPEEVGYFFRMRKSQNSTALPPKKMWLDNAIPSAHASLLHSFSVLTYLFPMSSYRDLFLALSKAYYGTAEKLVNAQGYAFTAIAEERTGITVIKCSPNIDFEPMFSLIREKSPRKVFFMTSKELTGFQICIGNQCLDQVSNCDELEKYL